MTEGIIVGVAVGALMILINALVRRAGVKTRQDALIEEVQELKVGNETILKVLLPVVLSVKGQKPNGEVEAALKLLNKYMIEK